MELARSLAVTLLLLIAGGCTVISSVALRHPQTGDTVRCQEYWYWNIFPREAQEEERERQRCVEDYERQGYAQVPYQFP